MPKNFSRSRSNRDPPKYHPDPSLGSFIKMLSS